jgi:hypothetical protein
LTAKTSDRITNLSKETMIQPPKAGAEYFLGGI